MEFFFFFFFFWGGEGGGDDGDGSHGDTRCGRKVFMHIIGPNVETDLYDNPASAILSSFTESLSVQRVQCEDEVRRVTLGNIVPHTRKASARLKIRTFYND